MRMRRLSPLATLAFALLAPPAAAQGLHEGAPTTPSLYKVEIQPGNYVMMASAIRWGSGAPPPAPRVTAPRAGPGADARAAAKPAANSVELIWPTQRADSQWVGLAHSAPRGATEITITAMNAAGTPVTRYLLHHATPTNYSIGMVDTGPSHLTLTHFTIIAESVSVVPLGS